MVTIRAAQLTRLFVQNPVWTQLGYKLLPLWSEKRRTVNWDCPGKRTQLRSKTQFAKSHPGNTCYLDLRFLSLGCCSSVIYYLLSRTSAISNNFCFPLRIRDSGKLPYLNLSYAFELWPAHPHPEFKGLPTACLPRFYRQWARALYTGGVRVRCIGCRLTVSLRKSLLFMLSISSCWGLANVALVPVSSRNPDSPLPTNEVTTAEKKN